MATATKAVMVRDGFVLATKAVEVVATKAVMVGHCIYIVSRCRSYYSLCARLQCSCNTISLLDDLKRIRNVIGYK